MLATEPCAFPAQGKGFFSKITENDGSGTSFNFSAERICDDNAFSHRKHLTNNSLVESNKRRPLPTETVVKTVFAVSNKLDKKSVSRSEPLTIASETEVANSDYVPNPTDLFFGGQARDEKLCEREEEERKLILASVKHVDCQDFPFDEVLSLENTVQESSLPAEDMRHRVSKTIRQCSGKPISSIPSGDLTIENKESLISKEQNLPLIETSKKNRPPFLKCSTWPKNNYYDENSMESFSENFSKPSEDVDNHPKPDSPSFYSSSAIDFSAISHLSEEHDKIMAQENNEKSSKNSTFISHTTKEKLYGKATQKSAKVNGKTRRESNKSKANTASTYTASSEVFSKALLTNVIPAGLNGITVSRTSIGETPSKKTPKSSISSLEKAFRKRYASASAVSVSSMPLSTLQNDPSPLVIKTQHLPSPENALNVEINDESKKHTHAIVEKQPLPPEGFKISRYPIIEESQRVQQPSPNDNDDQNPLGSADLHKIIGELRLQLNQAESRINEAEQQAREWKETAQQTLRAAQVLKAQLIDCQKKKTLSLETKADETKTFSKSAIPRRWSNEENVINKPLSKVSRPRYVSAETLRNNSCPVEQNNRLDGAKRAYPFEDSQTTTMKKKLTNLPEPTTTVNEISNSGENKSLLEWLDNTGMNEEEVDYMTYLETSETSVSCLTTNDNTILQRSEIRAPRVGTKPDMHQFHQNTTPQRLVSHSEVRKALRAKVGGSLTNSTEEKSSEMPQKSLQTMPNSLDQEFLENFPFSDHEINQSMEVFNSSDLLKHSEALSSETSHSDSELHANDVRKKPNLQTKIYLSRGQSNSESNLTKTFASEIICQERDFFNQLDSMLDL